MTPLTLKIAERKRDSKGRYVQVIEGGWKPKQSEYQKEYLRTHPWARNWQFSKSRAHTRNMEHKLTVNDFKLLWERDQAHLLTVPSIDRINPNLGYIEGNCRFIEKSLNSRLGNLGSKKLKVCPNCGWHNKTNV